MGMNIKVYMELRKGMSVLSVRNAKAKASGKANKTPPPA